MAIVQHSSRSKTSASHVCRGSGQPPARPRGRNPGGGRLLRPGENPASLSPQLWRAIATARQTPAGTRGSTPHYLPSSPIGWSVISVSLAGTAHTLYVCTLRRENFRADDVIQRWQIQAQDTRTYRGVLSTSKKKKSNRRSIWIK